MKFLIFIDRVYPKIMTFFLLLALPLSVISLYLYMNLPDIIPIQFGITLIPSNWGSKATIFIFPIVLLLVPTFMSKKTINSQEKSITGRIATEIIMLIVLAVILIMMIGAYCLYFKMI
ncbi:DUF1648 domain-containing protein [Lactococcus lactis]|uniref:DUF1648 domain-containing protein n=1 Tax=Lactococcus lactis TaxID=1358 RepID=A0AB35KCS1_9LACT|nr:DUF1648 domain-containing protein [Lactococcus lactis]MDG4979147.1 DUF1648 domain-containing protein [Lactococcus lactis]MDG5048902.1 DUF1648 domain-containing protein [Lactococcus lactis]